LLPDGRANNYNLVTHSSVGRR